MSKISFSIAKSITEYNNIKKYVDIIFSDNAYSKDCVIIDNLNLFSAFKYMGGYNYDYFSYINSKSFINEGLEYFLENNSIYLNYYGKDIYYLKYYKKLYCLFEIFEDDLDEDNFLKFLSRCFFCLDGNINDNLNHKVVYPKSKFIYNRIYGKFKNKKYKS